jgi:hypothetical protein
LCQRDPTAEIASEFRPRHPPLDGLEGKCVALLDIGKMRGDEFIDRLESLMKARGIETRRYKKPTNTRTAPTEIIHDITLNCHAVVIALSDCGSCTSCSTHDMFTLDGCGIPGVNVITEEFADAFEVQRRAIGFDGAAVLVPHPIQNRTRSELEGFDDQFCQEIISRMSGATTVAPWPAPRKRGGTATN